MLYVDNAGNAIVTSGLGESVAPATPLPGVVQPEPPVAIQLAKIQADTQADQAKWGFLSSVTSGIAKAGGDITSALLSKKGGGSRPIFMSAPAPAPSYAPPAPPSSGWGWGVGLGLAGAAAALAYFFFGRESRGKR